MGAGFDFEEDEEGVLAGGALEDESTDLAGTSVDVFDGKGEYCGTLAENTKVGDVLQGAENLGWNHVIAKLA